MRKLLTIAMAVVFLAASASWAQTVQKRKHTRPPYSGPMKGETKGKLKTPPFQPKSGGQGKTNKIQVMTGKAIVR